MEILTNFIQPTGLSPEVMGVTMLGGLALAVLRLLRSFHLIVPDLRLPFPAGLTLAAIPSLAFPVAARASIPRSEANPVREIEISPALDERVPPRSLVGAGDHYPPTHPAVHGDAERSARPLFPRHEGPLEPWERGVIDLRRAAKRRPTEPGGTAGDTPHRSTHYVVLPGDTLWDLAAKVLETDDMRAIARYWPRIHRENVDVIGRDPNLLRPGQVLSLPPTVSK